MAAFEEEEGRETRRERSPVVVAVDMREDDILG
jgi:hypothetical protein